jgi:hypothetical protein
MIKGRSALESLTMFGLVNDGPLSKGGLGRNEVKPLDVPGVTTADKLVSTPKPVKAKERKAVANMEPSRTDVANSVANKTRQQRYNEAHAEERKAKARERMAAKRAKGKA